MVTVRLTSSNTTPKGQGDEITPGKGAANVPGALASLAKAAQFHRVRDDVDAVKAR